MTEFWKSNERKHCDFCKCWIADNKISISYHEGGKKHKENVARHIAKLTKKSAADYKVQCKLDDEMAKMEKAAMAAYLKDAKNNPDITSQELNKIVEESKAMTETKDTPVLKIVWQEIQSDDGNVYYWNTETNETSWEKPEEFISLEQKNKEKEKDINDKRRQQKIKEEEAIKEVRALVEREKMKEKYVKKEKIKEEPTAAPSTTQTYGPTMRAADPYGAWTTIVETPKESIDLELPEVNKPAVPEIIIEEERTKFKIKQVESLGGEGVAFKKRKLPGNFKKNMRQKLDDD